jgi:creatinase/prolidase-like protein
MRRGLIARSREELPDAVFDTRLARLRAALRGLDALIVYTNNTRPAGVSWLAGFVPYWSEALLVLPRSGEPVLVVALTFRVKPWIERTSRVAEVIHTPRIGIGAARFIAAVKTDATVGVVDFDHVSTGVADDLREGGPHLSYFDASDVFAAARGSSDPAEIALSARAASIAGAALSRIEPTDSMAQIAAAVEGEARRLAAEEVYVAVAPDVARDRRLVRPDASMDLPRGPRFAVRATVAYKGCWVRKLVTIERGSDLHAGGVAFAAAVARLPSEQALSEFAYYLVEGCRMAQPLEALMGSRIAEPRRPAAGGVVSVQACIEVDGKPVLVGAPVLIGAPGEAASILA